MPVLLSVSYSIISIHALLAESDEFQSVGIALLFISIHALLAESDPHRPTVVRCPTKFLSTLSLRRATRSDHSVCSSSQISIHALLAESDKSYRHNGRNQNNISIHALLAESDSARKVAAVRAYKISIHALLAESDDTGPRQRGPDGHFYPRSPCGERPPAGKVRPWASHISIHALLAESDGLLTHNGHPQYISIHALLAESDNRGWCNTMAARRISIHALLAESDRHWQMGHSLTRQFLCTLSLRRATFAALYDILKLFPISIHALLAESDKPSLYGLYDTYAFLSTLSLRRATPVSALRVTSRTHFYPRSPCGERLPG